MQQQAGRTEEHRQLRQFVCPQQSVSALAFRGASGMMSAGLELKAVGVEPACEGDLGHHL